MNKEANLSSKCSGKQGPKENSGVVKDQKYVVVKLMNIITALFI